MQGMSLKFCDIMQVSNQEGGIRLTTTSANKQGRCYPFSSENDMEKSRSPAKGEDFPCCQP